MKDHKSTGFWEKYSRKFIALIVALSLLLSISGIGAAFALIRNRRKTEDTDAATEATQATTEAATQPKETEPSQTEPEETKPDETEPEETLTTEEEMQQAVTQLNEAIGKDTGNAELYTQRAALQYNLGHTEEAIQDYTTALKLKDIPQTRYLRAIVYSTVGDNQRAYEDLSVALKALPNNQDYLSLMADICNALQRYDQALECLEKLLAAKPNNCVLHTLAGDACVYLGNYEKAAPHYEQAIAACSGSTTDGISKASLYSAYGNTLKMLNRFSEAAVAYKNSLQLQDNKELYFQKGFCLLQSENYADAAADFTKCIELGYETASASFQRGLCYYATANYSNAVADFKVYEAAFPDKTDTYLYMGLCYQNLEQYQSAITYYQKCISANISVGTCQFNIGNCYYNLGDHRNAVTHYTESINLDSYIYESLLNRGVCYIKLNKYNEAKVDLKRVIDECKDTTLVESATKSYDPIKNITIITKG